MDLFLSSPPPSPPPQPSPTPSPPTQPQPTPPPSFSFYLPPDEPHPPLICNIHRVSNHNILYPVDINHPFFSDPPNNCYIYRTADGYSLYRVNLHESLFTVTVTANPFIVDSWLHDVINQIPARLKTESSTVVVGLDARRGRSWRNNGRGILQLCVRDRCLVFQYFQAPSVPQSLRDFLSDDLYCFITFEYRSEGIKKFLANSPHAVDITDAIICLKVRALQQGEICNSSRKTLEQYLEFIQDSSEVRNSDWCQPFLSNKQIIHASIHARCAFLIGQTMSFASTY